MVTTCAGTGAVHAAHVQLWYNGHMTRAGIVVVDATHWLDDDGDLPYAGSITLFRNALRVAQCIEYGGPSPKKHVVHTMIECRRRPSNTPCRGTLMVLKTERDELYVFCPKCRAEEFLISNWQNTMWADGVPNPIAVDSNPFDEDTARPKAEPPGVFRPDGSLNLKTLRALIATAEKPMTVLECAFAEQPPPTEAAAQEMMTTIMTLWNSTPRPDLGGKTPDEVHRTSRPPPATSTRVGRNTPCPCGSGKKYKRCCGAH